MPNAPSEFQFCIADNYYFPKIDENDKKTQKPLDYDIFVPQQNCQYFVKYRHFMPFTGVAEIRIPNKDHNIPVYIENHFKSEKLLLWFKTREDLQMYHDFRYPAPEKVDKVQIFVPAQFGWNPSKVCIDLSLDQYVGYRHYFDQIVQEITDWLNNAEKLNRINLQSGKSFLLYGDPGAGKTSLIRLVAQHFNVPIYVNSGSCKKVGGSHNDADYPFLISTWEDFDRYLVEANEKGHTKNSSYMSDLLNAIDGCESQSNVVRFFTGNDCKIIKENQALYSRMSAVFQFKGPVREMYDARIKAIDKELETKLSESPFYEELLDEMVESKMSLRELVLILVRSIFRENPCEKVLAEVKDRIANSQQQLVEGLKDMALVPLEPVIPW